MKVLGNILVLFIISCLSYGCSQSNSKGNEHSTKAEQTMTEDQSQKTWNEYYLRVKNRRVAEADILWEQMTSKGMTESTVLALDFSLFCSDEEGIKNIEQQLSESYSLEIKYNPEGEVWIMNGTTRPDGITLEKSQHRSWVEFMSDVTASYGCVFSNWTIESPELNLVFKSELIDSDMP